MHIAEGILSPAQCAVWYAASAPFVVWGAREVMKQVKEHPERKLLLGTAGAVTLLLSAIKLPSVTGSSSHPTGTGVGAVLFKPPVMAFLSTIVLIFQALLLAHGGITTLGANVFSMGIVGPWCGYAVYMLCKKLKAPGVVGIALAMIFADLTTYLMTSVQLGLALPDAHSGVMGSVAKFMTIFGYSQIPLALIEGILGVVLFRFLAQVAGPQLVDLGVLDADAMTEMEGTHV